MPELLQQVQISPPPNDEVLDEVGKPRKIFRPTQDALHMEGEFFENRYQRRLTCLGYNVCFRVISKIVYWSIFFLAELQPYSWSGAD
jgi:hypothetical protein